MIESKGMKIISKLEERQKIKYEIALLGEGKVD